MPIINNLSGNEIEILKLADFLTGVEHDITDVYFGELQVFTVWAETEGALPLTVNANGEPLTDYKIYGNTVQDGTPTPENPSGCGVRTGNLWDDNWFDKNVSDNILRYVPLYVGEGQFTCYTTCPRMDSQSDENASRFIFFLSGRVNTGAQNAVNGVWLNHPRTVTSSEGYVTLCYRKMNMYDVSPWEYKTMLVKGSTAPDQYIPYGYKLPLTSAGQDVDIYIGSTPLEQGEYVDYGTQKIYKYVDGVLTPIDPPVALPAIPTLDGTTVYDTDLVTKPSKMYVKYRKHGT